MEIKESRLIGVSEDGNCLYHSPLGPIYLLTKEEMRNYEHLHIYPELSQPGYDPIWSYNWLLLTFQKQKELEAINFVKSLSQDQIDSLET